MNPAPSSTTGAAKRHGTPPLETARDFFRALAGLGRLRVISPCGPSTFEALCEFGPHGYADGFMNAMTDAYHWHVDLARFRHVRSCEKIHARSGRRVLFFELREDANQKPFLFVYLHRGPREEFGVEREEAFAALHRTCEAGVSLRAEASS
ncbi:MAG: hypothetical protein MJE66_15240 [Proteobacteria bacterium]|nr:hypothetical protein [Pseudomonadota bacterium]